MLLEGYEITLRANIYTTFIKLTGIKKGMTSFKIYFLMLLSVEDETMLSAGMCLALCGTLLLWWLITCFFYNIKNKYIMPLGVYVEVTNIF